ncbi:MAG: ribonuclease III [Lachnospiraceae bacterium]|nr:ribonuclease III [Lachnospiraceae bacterium]
MEESMTYLRESFALPEVDIRTYSPATLAYIGDAIYDLIIRTILVERGNRSANSLHKEASAYVKASAQSALADALMDELSEEEQQYFRRGRNAHPASMAKNASMHDYRRATGFEALMGYLYLTGQMTRMIDLIRLGLERTGGTP